MNKFLFLAISLIFLSSCGNTPKKVFSIDGLEIEYKAEYAEGFEMYNYGTSTILKIKNLWDSSSEGELVYFLSRNGETAPEGFNGPVIHLPVSNIVCMSSTYTAFLEKLGKEEVITGVSGGDFISSSYIRNKLESKHIRDIGYSNSINLELLLDLEPELILTYGITGEGSVLGPKAEELGLESLYIGEYLEMSPLGKAEWIMVFAELVGKKVEAKKIFDEITVQYNELKNNIPENIQKPTVILNAPWRDTWFVPGDRNYIVKLINDAGAEYICKGFDSESSRPISVENAYLYAMESDFWLNPGSATSLPQLIYDNPNFSDIPSVKKGNVYNNTKRNTPQGGSDFWESGAINPHIILKDLVRIFHSDLLPDHELYYFVKLN